MGNILKVILIIVGIIVVGYIGVVIYANAVGFNKQDKPQIPEVKEAQYALQITNTGQVYFTAYYERLGSCYVMPNFWEQSGNTFRYRNRELVLDEKIYGPIEVVKRKLPTTTAARGK